MRIAFWGKRIWSYILAAAFLVTAFTGCSFKRADSAKSSGHATKQYDSCVFSHAELEGVIRDMESLEYLDYSDGKCIAVTDLGVGRHRYISFVPNGTEVKSFEIRAGAPGMSCKFATDNEQNLYMYYETYKSEYEIEDLASLFENYFGGGEDITGDFSVFISDAAVVKFDNKGKELFDINLTDMVTGEGHFDINNIFWTKNTGLILDTTKGIMKCEKKSGVSEYMGLDVLGESYADCGYLFRGAKGKLFASIGSEDAEYAECYRIDLDNMTLSDPLNVFNDKDYDFFRGVVYDFYAADSEALYGYDGESGKCKKLVDFAESGLVPSSNGRVLEKAVILSDNYIVADLSDDEGFNANLCKLKRKAE